MFDAQLEETKTLLPRHKMITAAMVKWPDQKVMRDEMRDKKVCICGPRSGGVGKSGVVHGPVVGDSGKCQRCLDIAKESRKGSIRARRP